MIPRVVEWTRWMLDSYRHWTGRDLIERIGEPESQSCSLFNASFVVVSHGTEADPILNYANQAALDLWDMSWDRMVTTPSRLTAEPVARTERERMLTEARALGFIDHYQGVRITSTGRRFLVDDARVWTVMNHTGQSVGQAATFGKWTWQT